MNVETENIIEEIKDIVEKCINCGLCRGTCPVFSVLKEEQYSPRGKTLVLNENLFGKSVFLCTLCKSCEVNCPLDLKLCDAFKKARKVLADRKRDSKENKEIIKNILDNRNPYIENKP